MRSTLRLAALVGAIVTAIAPLYYAWSPRPSRRWWQRQRPREVDLWVEFGGLGSVYSKLTLEEIELVAACSLSGSREGQRLTPTPTSARVTHQVVEQSTVDLRGRPAATRRVGRHRPRRPSSSRGLDRSRWNAPRIYFSHDAERLPALFVRPDADCVVVADVVDHSGGLVGNAQYHFPRTNPPNAASPMSTTIKPIQKLQMKARTTPTMTMIPPSEIPPYLRSAIPASPFSSSVETTDYRALRSPTYAPRCAAAAHVGRGSGPTQRNGSRETEASGACRLPSASEWAARRAARSPIGLEHPQASPAGDVHPCDP